ncbi:hypothetical protein LAZ67_23001006 [Cordylochernes scorpioides]|uniref:Uncharacterized protein n=1 Tax=Cordylochernes scorpioides TaxID=51811 RepID=A0ABY6LQS5_9ARAC|nr:hypothetical protein LAZ67_23001006 [Cordylochernes scorpioides]
MKLLIIHHTRPDLSPTDYHFFKHLANFLGEKCFINQGDAETAFNEFIASRLQSVKYTVVKIYYFRAILLLVTGYCLLRDRSWLGAGCVVSPPEYSPQNPRSQSLRSKSAKIESTQNL